MSTYSDKEKTIIKQCSEGPFYKLVTKLTLDEFNNFVDKLIKDDDSYTLAILVTIYWDYNRNKMIDYFIDKGDVDLLLGFLDCCHDFNTKNSELDQKYIVDKLIEKNDKKFVKDILESNYIFFLTDVRQKDRLLKFIL